MNTPTSCVNLLEKGSGLSKKVAAISKWKMNLQMCIYKQRWGLQTQPLSLENSLPFIVSMSSPNNPTRRITTRGGARDKMAKVMEHVRSGGIAKGNPNQPKSKVANTVKKPRTTKKADGTAAEKVDVAAKKALAANLAQLKDKFLEKANIGYLSHLCQWTGEVQGNAAPL